MNLSHDVTYEMARPTHLLACVFVRASVQPLALLECRQSESADTKDDMSRTLHNMLVSPWGTLASCDRREILPEPLTHTNTGTRKGVGVTNGCDCRARRRSEHMFQYEHGFLSGNFSNDLWLGTVTDHDLRLRENGSITSNLNASYSFRPFRLLITILMTIDGYRQCTLFTIR